MMKPRQIVAVFLLLIAGWLFVEGWVGERSLGQVRQLITQYYHLANATSDIQKKNLALQTEIRQLRDDKFWIEKQVREKLGWAKSGEVIYKFKNVEESGNTQ